jgi:hypothetical protein
VKRSLALLAIAASFGTPVARAQQPGAGQPPADPSTADVPPPAPAPAPPPEAPPSQPAAPQGEPPPARTQGYEATSTLPYGVTISADLGGGGRLGGGSQYTSRGIFEGEVTAGYDLAMGIRPELSVMLGLAPHSYAGLRLGVHYSVADSPFYARFALDGSTERGTARWRWLLGGAGGEVRLTDVLGGFAEADLGIPLSSGAGVPVLIRAGVTFRL